MTAFVILVTPEAQNGRVSSEAYNSLPAAQKFVESRSGKPEKLSEYKYRAEDYTTYEIVEVNIK